jgi:hypothetical protein
MSHIKTHKTTPTYFDHQLIIIRELDQLMIEICQSDFVF